MSDFWSGMFLLAIIVITIILIILVLLMALIRKKDRYLTTTLCSIVAALLSIWTADRFLAGSFCFPWECVNREMALDDLLLNESELPNDWVVEQTFNYAYIPRASSAYAERTFYSDLKSLSNNFSQEIYQYRSIRGASFQYDSLESDVPGEYSERDKPASHQISIQANHATKYMTECLYGSYNICYYVAQYEEYILVVRMPLFNRFVPTDDFIEIVRLVDEKFSRALHH